jgi:hypothetical protein
MNKQSTTRLIEETTKGNTIAMSALKRAIETRIDNVGPVMDDYDGGQVAAYRKVLTYLDRISNNRIDIISVQS